MTRTTTHRLSEFLVGLLFGWGLMLAGMTDPGKVIGFLDLAGAWDPSLAFVMGGAIAVGFFAFGSAKKRTSNFFGGALHLPTSRDIDKRLVPRRVRSPQELAGDITDVLRKMPPNIDPEDFRVTTAKPPAPDGGERQGRAGRFADADGNAGGQQAGLVRGQAQAGHRRIEAKNAVHAA
jgi:hypothetical protein